MAKMQRISSGILAEVRAAAEAARKQRRREARVNRERALYIVIPTAMEETRKEETREEKRAIKLKKRQTVEHLHRMIDVAIRTVITKHSCQRPGAMRWEALVGYTFDELKTHIEGLFYDGMTWDNYGDWHIHHKVPRAKFRDGIASVKECWALNNLEPLWAGDHAEAHKDDNVYNIMAKQAKAI